MAPRNGVTSSASSRAAAISRSSQRTTRFRTRSCRGASRSEWSAQWRAGRRAGAPTRSARSSLPAAERVEPAALQLRRAGAEVERRLAREPSLECLLLAPRLRLGRLLVQAGSHAGGAAALGDARNDDGAANGADRDLEPVPDADGSGRLHALAVDVYVPAGDSVARRASRLEEARGPQPLVDPRAFSHSSPARFCQGAVVGPVLTPPPSCSADDGQPTPTADDNVVCSPLRPVEGGSECPWLPCFKCRVSRRSDTRNPSAASPAGRVKSTRPSRAYSRTLPAQARTGSGSSTCGRRRRRRAASPNCSFRSCATSEWKASRRSIRRTHSSAPDPSTGWAERRASTS